jgi:hypothetical protein
MASAWCGRHFIAPSVTDVIEIVSGEISTKYLSIRVHGKDIIVVGAQVGPFPILSVAVTS